jgi:PAS domain S-box-containing protein
MGSLFSSRSRSLSALSVLIALVVGIGSYLLLVPVMHHWAFLVAAVMGALVFGLAYMGFSARSRERELQLSQKFLETILGQLPVALFCKDIKNSYRFSMWNKKAEALWGMRSEDVIGKSDYDFFPREQADWFRKKDEDTVLEGDMLVIPEELVTSPVVGEVYVRTRKVIIRNEEGEPLLLLGISEDITEQKRSQEIIEQQRLQMVNTAKMTALGEMAGGIAHEINNPLAIIEIYASQLSMLAEAGKLEDTKVTKAASVISATVDRIARITKGLRSFARDAENDPFVKSELRQILTETMEFCQEKFSKNGIKLELVMDPLQLEVECRPVQISQVLLNLMNNSFDAVLGTEKAWVKVEAHDEGKRVLISVTDSGTGISDSIADKIMQPFFTTKSVGKGTGLGLSISQGIIHSHQGELYLDPHSKNTRFVIAIPKQVSKIELGTRK